MSLSSAISSSSSTYVGAVLHESPQVTSRKRQNSEETCKPSFEVESLAATIFAQLLGTLGQNGEQRVVIAANQLSVSNIEIMLQLSVYRPSVVLKIFQDYLQASTYEEDVRRLICKVVHQLCIISVLNSKYQDTMVMLEKKIGGYLEASQQGRFREMIDATKKLLATPVIKQLAKLQDHSCALRQAGADISEALDLFYYVSDDSQECIGILAQKTKLQNGALRYPLCGQHFTQFCQNLNLLSNERSELLGLQTQLRAKQNLMDAEIKFLWETQESKKASLPSTAMIPSRDRFYNENVSLLWTVGGELLKRVFIATLVYKQVNKGWPLPRGFVPAINESAALSPNWGKFHFDKLFPKKGPSSSFSEFDGPFVWNVWGNYAKGIDHLTDLGCFMRQFINELSEQSFQQLAKAPAEKRGHALEQVFFRKFTRNATFVTLKNWALTLKPLRE